MGSGLKGAQWARVTGRTRSIARCFCPQKPSYLARCRTCGGPQGHRGVTRQMDDQQEVWTGPCGQEERTGALSEGAIGAFKSLSILNAHKQTCKR